MISYAPLWETMKRKNATVSTNTLDALCRILDCELDDIIAYLPDETE